MTVNRDALLCPSSANPLPRPPVAGSAGPLPAQWVAWELREDPTTGEPIDLMADDMLEVLIQDWGRVTRLLPPELVSYVASPRREALLEQRTRRQSVEQLVASGGFPPSPKPSSEQDENTRTCLLALQAIGDMWAHRQLQLAMPSGGWFARRGFTIPGLIGRPRSDELTEREVAAEFLNFGLARFAPRVDVLVAVEWQRQQGVDLFEAACVDAFNLVVEDPAALICQQCGRRFPDRRPPGARSRGFCTDRCGNAARQQHRRARLRSGVSPSS